MKLISNNGLCKATLELITISLCGCFSGEQYDLTEQTVLVRVTTTQPTNPVGGARVNGGFIGDTKTRDSAAVIGTFSGALDYTAARTGEVAITNSDGSARVTLDTASNAGFFRTRYAGEMVKQRNWLFRVETDDTVDYIAMLPIEVGRTVSGSKFALSVVEVGPMVARDPRRFGAISRPSAAK